MATLDDVQNSMVDSLYPVFYPNGSNNPSILNKDIYIAAGNFLKEDVDNGLKQGVVFVEVFAQKGMNRNTTRVRPSYTDQILDLPTIFFNSINNVVTIFGVPTAGQAAILIVNDIPYSYKILSGDTINVIAQQLANIIPSATVINNQITIANAYSIMPKVSVRGTMRKVLQTEEGIFRVRVIASNYNDRSLISKNVQLCFANLTNRYYLPMPDATYAFIRARGIEEINTYELANSFVRDHLYLVEYHLTNVDTFSAIEDVTANIEVKTQPIN